MQAGTTALHSPTPVLNSAYNAQHIIHIWKISHTL